MGIKLFDDIKQKRSEEQASKVAEQQLRIQRLAELDAGLAGYKDSRRSLVPHPIKNFQSKKEIKRLKKEIEQYNKAQKLKKQITIFIGLFVVLFGFIGIMAALENKEAQNKNDVAAETTEQVTVESEMSIAREETIEEIIAERVIFSKPEIDVAVGATFDVEYKIEPENADLTTVDLMLSNDNVKQNDDGSFYAVAPGHTTITASQQGRILASCKVHAEIKEAETLIFTIPNITMFVGDQVNLEYSLLPQYAQCEKVIMEVSDADVAQVVNLDDNPSQFAAIGLAEGKTTIIATLPNQSQYIQNIEVRPAEVKEIALSYDEDKKNSFTVGDALQITALLEPENAIDKTIHWYSSDDNIFTVSSTGLISAINEGTASLIVEANNGIKSELPISVKPKPPKFRVSWSATMTSNDHVGGNWTKEFEVNGTPCASGTIVTVTEESEIQYRLEICENDSRPDCAVSTDKIAITGEILKNGFSAEGELYVRENGGRYSGNSASWTYRIQFTPVK